MDEETKLELSIGGLRFRVFGVPVPKGSTRAWISKKTGRAYVTDSAGVPLKSWSTNIQDRALEAVKLLFKAEQPDLPLFPEGVPVTIDLGFAFARPKSAKKRLWPTVRPDLDKAIRGVLDACTGILWADDSQVIVLSAHKQYGEIPCCDVEVKAL